MKPLNRREREGVDHEREKEKDNFLLLSFIILEPRAEQ